MERINKNSLFKIILGLSVIIIIGLIFYISMTIKDIKEISNEIYMHRVDLEEKYQSGLSLRENIQELASAQPIIDSIKQSFIDHENTLSFINDLEKEADSLGLDLIINIPEVDIKEGKINTSGIQLNLNGRAESIFKFINILDQKPYYININDLTISAKDNTTNEPDQDISANINGTIYWQ